jgi:glutaconate CoA-transferase subunit A
VFQRAYVAAAADPDRWAAFRRTFLDVDEAGYQRAVSAGQPA